jgi:hypothetical protein
VTVARLADWLRRRRDLRKAKREAEHRLRMIAAKARLMENVVDTGESPTGIFNTVKATVDQATEEKRKAREAAQRILGPDKKP